MWSLGGLGFSMNARDEQTFPVGKLTGIVESICPSGAVVGFARVSHFGHTRTFVGDLTVQWPCSGPRRVHMLLAIPPQYHDREFLEDLRAAVFSAFQIPEEETWSLVVCPPSVIEFQSEPGEGYCEFTS